MNDSEIIRDVLNGDQKKYALIVEKYQSNVFRTAIGFVHSKEDAEDIAQDVFIQVFRLLGSFEGKSELSTWLYRITVNRSINFLKSEKRKRFWSSFTNAFQPVSKENPVIRRLEDAEENLFVKKAIDALPENQRTAFVLRKYEGLSQKETANIMRLTEGAVEQLLIRAKINLRKKLGSFVGK